MDVFPIPPGPMRAIGVRFSARPMIFSISSSRPKQFLGGGGGDSPGGILYRSKTVGPIVFKRDGELTWLEPRNDEHSAIDG